MLRVRSWSGHIPGLQVWPPSQGMNGGNNCCFSLSLFLSLSLSLTLSLPHSLPSCLSKINNCIHRWGLKMALASEIFCYRRWWTRGVVSSEWLSPFSPGGVLEINKFWLGLCFSFKIFIYLFSRDREGKERGRETSVPLTRPLLGTWPTTQACALTGNWTSNRLVCRPVLNPLSHTGQDGHTIFDASCRMFFSKGSKDAVVTAWTPASVAFLLCYGSICCQSQEVLVHYCVQLFAFGK